MEAIGQLAGGVAHDFNNLLTVIAAATRFALRELGPDDDAPARATSTRSRRRPSAPRTLTHQLLAFSRRQVLQPQRARPQRGRPRDASAMLGRLIGEHIEIQLDLAPDARPRPRRPRSARAGDRQPRRQRARRDAEAAARLTLRTANVVLADRAPTATRVDAGSYVMLAVRDTGRGHGRGDAGRASSSRSSRRRRPARARASGSRRSTGSSRRAAATSASRASRAPARRSRSTSRPRRRRSRPSPAPAPRTARARGLRDRAARRGRRRRARLWPS